LSEKKQAKRIGCSWGTWSKTDCFRDAVELGWLPKRKKSDKRGGTPPSVVSLTDTLEATVGVGEQDEIVNQLAAAETAAAENRQWKDLTSEEQRAILAEHEAEVANEPSPLESRPGRFTTAGAREHQSV